MFSPITNTVARSITSSPVTRWIPPTSASLVSEPRASRLHTRSQKIRSENSEDFLICFINMFYTSQTNLGLFYDCFCCWGWGLACRHPVLSVSWAWNQGHLQIQGQVPQIPRQGLALYTRKQWLSGWSASMITASLIPTWQSIEAPWADDLPILSELWTTKHVDSSCVPLQISQNHCEILEA